MGEVWSFTASGKSTPEYASGYKWRIVFLFQAIKKTFWLTRVGNLRSLVFGLLRFRDGLHFLPCCHHGRLTSTMSDLSSTQSLLNHPVSCAWILLLLLLWVSWFRHSCNLSSAASIQPAHVCTCTVGPSATYEATKTMAPFCCRRHAPFDSISLRVNVILRSIL